MSKTDSLHYQLCSEGAEYLLRLREPWHSKNKWAVVEIICQGMERPDVWASDGTDSTVIEVKTSHQDFLNDRRKYGRGDDIYKNRDLLGNYHYYLCPEGIIKEDELPKEWGLLYWKDNKITKIKDSSYLISNKIYDFYILSSILRREVGVNKVFNYRCNNI